MPSIDDFLCFIRVLENDPILFDVLLLFVVGHANESRCICGSNHHRRHDGANFHDNVMGTQATVAIVAQTLQARIPKQTNIFDADIGIVVVLVVVIGCIIHQRVVDKLDENVISIDNIVTVTVTFGRRRRHKMDNLLSGFPIEMGDFVDGGDLVLVFVAAGFIDFVVDVTDTHRQYGWGFVVSIVVMVDAVKTQRGSGRNKSGSDFGVPFVLNE